MPFTTKSWQDAPSTSTPLSAAAIIDLESRVAGYADPVMRTYWPSGSFVSTYGISGTGVPGEAVLQYTPLIVPPSASLDQMMVEVQSAGTAGALVRAGIYSAGTNGRPNTLLLDAGTVAGDSTGIKVIDLTATPFSFSASGLFWFAAVVQGGAGTRPTMRVANAALWPPAYITSANWSTNTPGAITESAVSGALPSSSTPAAVAAGPGTRVWARVV